MAKQYIRYIYNHIIFTVIIWLCLFVSGATATISDCEFNKTYISTSGSETFESIITSVDDINIVINSVYHKEFRKVSTGTLTVFTQLQYSGTFTTQTNYIESVFPSGAGTANHIIIPKNKINENMVSHKGTSTRHTITSSRTFGKISGSDSYYTTRLKLLHTIAFINGSVYTVSGDSGCVDDVTLYIYEDSTWKEIAYKSLNNSGDNYEFNIYNATYKLEFGDTHSYEFTCTGNEIYNHDVCGYQILHYVDDCANLLKNPCINIIVNDDYVNPLILDGTSHTDVFIIGTDIQLNDKLDIWIGTDQGEQYRKIYTTVNENYLYHNYKSWNLDVTVYDINTSVCVSDAKVSVEQDCRINDHAHNTHADTNLYGYAKFHELSNQPYQVKVTKDGYNIFGYTTINAGFDAQHTNIPLSIYIQDSTKGDGNGSIGEPPNGGQGGGGDTVLPQTPCSILWTDNDTKSITEINNTQGARLYFMAPNCSATLYIESRNTNTHTWNIETYIGLSPLQTGYSQIVPSDWTYPITKRYRGRLYAYDCGCDATDDLKVWHHSDPNITIIANLSSNVMFRHKVGGLYINPSSPIHILSSASSNNTTLLNIDLELFNESVKVDGISYTFFDYYDSGSFNPIKWEPNYKFTAGYKYCVYMYSNNILVDFDTVFANATSDNPFSTGNTLTVKVYDHNLLPLQYSTVYVESWTSMDTGATNEITFSGLGDDTYEYRAIKSGYLDRGFDSVTLSADATVSYILDIIDTEHAVRDIRMSDTDIKAMLYPIVFFILILLLIGVLIDAVN